MTIQQTWRRNFRTLWLGQFIAIAGLTVLVPLLPIYMASLKNLNVIEIQLWSGVAIAAPAITTMLASPLWGKLGDRLSRKWMVLRALFGLGLCLLLMSFCTTPFQFVLVRLLQGLFGGVVEASSAFASGEAPESERGAVLGKLQSAVSAGSLVGPLIGGVLATMLGFQALLLLIGLVTLFMSILGIFFLIETTQTPINSEQPQVKKSIRQSMKCLLCTQLTCRFIIVGVLANFAMYGMMTALAPLVSTVNQLQIDDRAAVGILQSAFWTASMISAPFWGYFNDKAYVKNVYIVASVLCGMSVLWQGMATDLWMLGIARVLQGLTYSALIQSVMFVVVNASHQQLKGTFVGSTNSFLVVGQIVGSLSGAMVTSYTEPATTFILMGVIFAFSSTLLWTSHIKNQKISPVLTGFWEVKEQRAKF
ncbi:MFS transporter [Staphylococcus intermedius]|uniref:Drug transporter n=1 Tax=Staphylococcus intermedius NCTC 11048 TaxID=1141106 RepID=A0A380GAT8_STAIN|nr:MFS transporter [Staphylococcus intermedius]PCF65563.1 MFS transporter [Staphylococcus intermedius]PCF81242.1 MFS transporter [Staphylococcus intermedius]PCF82525.1 MFS transporter [Staphylococcus intermedius]PCF87224.1 MFS transporter [Staphylococcus intermedius]PNZ54106.1 MFS transporter [Staphylococcus intermedius NCTC 11048]